jgi:phosphoenolpyruvate synthase/pyruvate phosphate dikinase
MGTPLACAPTPTCRIRRARVCVRARGIGLCRTEHMFFGEADSDRPAMILADNEADRRKALNELGA